MNKKLNIALNIVEITLLIIVLTTLIIRYKVILKEEKKPEDLIIEELVEIYGSEVYTYTIEELPIEHAQEHIKYSCLIKFYDGKNYTERIMYVDEESNFVYTEIVIEDKEFE